MYVAGRLDTPGMGIIHATPLEKAATYVPYEIVEKLAKPASRTTTAAGGSAE